MTTMDYSGELNRRKALSVTEEITTDGSPSNIEMKTDFQPIQNTGRRNISVLTANGFTNGVTRIQRRNNSVVLTVVNLTRTTAGAGALAAISIPEGFRPSDNFYFLGRNLSTTVEHYVNATTGDLILTNPPTSTYFSLCWITDQVWPTALPGTAV